MSPINSSKDIFNNIPINFVLFSHDYFTALGVKILSSMILLTLHFFWKNKRSLGLEGNIIVIFHYSLPYNVNHI